MGKLFWVKAWLNQRIERLYDVLFVVRDYGWSALRPFLRLLPAHRIPRPGKRRLDFHPTLEESASGSC